MKVSWHSFKTNGAYGKNLELNKKFIFFKRELEIRYKKYTLMWHGKKWDKISKKLKN